MTRPVRGLPKLSRSMSMAPRILRRAGILAAIAAALTLATAAGAGAAPLLLTGNYDAGTVSVINTQTGAAVGSPIEAGLQTSNIAIVPGGQAFVTEFGTDSVGVIDTKTLKPVTTIPVGEGPESIAVSPDGKTAYVADDESAEVTVLDTASDSVVGSIPLSSGPGEIAFAPNGKFAYVVVNETLEVIDTATRKVVGTPIEVGSGPRTIAFSPDGTTAYIADESSGEVSIVNTGLGKEVGSIPVGTTLWGVAVSPDGSRLYVTDTVAEGTVTVISTATDKPIGNPIKVGERPFDIAITPDGRKAYVADYDSKDVTPIDLTTDKALAPIPVSGGAWQLAITPDLSPTASFTPPSALAGFPTVFSGAASTDPDGSVASWNWTFGDGGFANGVSPIHTYGTPGTYTAQLSVVDNEGCGEATVFTGRTAYCGGNPLAKATHPIEVKVPPALCTAKFGVGRAIHNRRNGTVRLQVKLPAAGSILLFGPKLHAVTRKASKAGSMFLTLHARVRLNKRLKKTHRARVGFRLTFTPKAGCGSKTVHRSLALLRAPRHRHHHR